MNHSTDNWTSLKLNCEDFSSERNSTLPTKRINLQWEQIKFLPRILTSPAPIKFLPRILQAYSSICTDIEKVSTAQRTKEIDDYQLKLYEEKYGPISQKKSQSRSNQLANLLGGLSGFDSNSSSVSDGPISPADDNDGNNQQQIGGSQSSTTSPTRTGAGASSSAANFATLIRNLDPVTAAVWNQSESETVVDNLNSQSQQQSQTSSQQQSQNLLSSYVPQFDMAAFLNPNPAPSQTPVPMDTSGDTPKHQPSQVDAEDCKRLKAENEYMEGVVTNEGQADGKTESTETDAAATDAKETDKNETDDKKNTIETQNANSSSASSSSSAVVPNLQTNTTTTTSTAQTKMTVPTEPILWDPAAPFNPLNTPQGLRCLYMFLCFPYLHDDEYYESMARIFRGFRSLSRLQKGILSSWLAEGTLQEDSENSNSSTSSSSSSSYPFPLFQTQVQAIQQYISIGFCSAVVSELPDPEDISQTPQHVWDFFVVKTSQVCKNALSCLDIFFKANEILRKKLRIWKKQERIRGTAAMMDRNSSDNSFSRQPQILKPQDFINDALNEQERLISHDYGYSLYGMLLRWEDQEEIAQRSYPSRIEAETIRHQYGRYQKDKPRPRVPTTIAEIEDQSGINTNTYGLVSYNFCLDASGKCKLLMLNTKDQQKDITRQEVQNQILQNRNPFERGGPRIINPYLTLKVRRDPNYLIPDVLQRLAGVSRPSEFRKTLKIEFQGEPGQDEGGVKKEFFQLLLEQLYNPEYGMFIYNKDNKTYWFNLASYESNLNFELFGTLLGLAIYNRVILDIRFPLVVYQKLLSSDKSGHLPFTLNDLLDIDPLMAKSLQELLDWDESKEGNGTVKDIFCRDYVATYESFGAQVVEPLIEGGEDIAITGENRGQYVEDYIDWYFNKSISDKFRSFKKGFQRCFLDDNDQSTNLFLTLFKPDELELLICGSQSLDFDAYKKNTDYQDGYTATTEVITWFWDIVINELNKDEQRELLAFITGSGRAPPKGLSASEARLTIGRSGPDSDQLPSAHTCFNHLLIPEYVDKEKLRKKLKLAILNNQGFGLI